MSSIDIARFRTAARQQGWIVEDAEGAHLTISRRRGLSPYWFRVGIYLIPVGIGLVLLLFHFVLKAFGCHEIRQIDLALIEGGFYAHLLR
ncbi:MAG: hypothetical protein AAF491_03175 [Verrucomicrobiota bacterium]